MRSHGRPRLKPFADAIRVIKRRTGKNRRRNGDRPAVADRKRLLQTDTKAGPVVVSIPNPDLALEPRRQAPAIAGTQFAEIIGSPRLSEIAVFARDRREPFLHAIGKRPRSGVRIRRDRPARSKHAKPRASARPLKTCPPVRVP